MIRPRQAWPLLVEAVKAWSADYAPSMGAALSYYTLFSIAPLLLIVIAVAGLFFGEQAVRGELSGSLQYLMGEQGAQAIEALLANVSEPKTGIIATAIGLFVLLLGATSVFGELQNDLDRIWRAPLRDAAGGVWGMLRQKLLSLGMILCIAFLLMVSLVFDAVLSTLGKMWGDFGAWQALGQFLNLLVSFALTTVVFALIYKLMPRAKVEWHDVWVGAAVTAILFAIGKFLIGLYIGRSAIGSTFGAAGSLAVMMVWVYYSAQIFLLGAEFTWVYAHRYGSRRSEVRPGTVAPPPMKAAKPPDPLPLADPASPPVPVMKRKPLVTFGVAAAIGATLGALLGSKPEIVLKRRRFF